MSAQSLLRREVPDVGGLGDSAGESGWGVVQMSEGDSRRTEESETGGSRDAELVALRIEQDDVAQLLAVELLAHEGCPHAARSATFARISCSRSAMSHGGSPATRMSMCIRFLAVLPSGTRRNPMAGPFPSGSMIEAPSGSS